MKFNLFSIALLAFSVLFMSCTQENENVNDYGRLAVRLTDAPFPHDLVAEANVTVFKIDARYKGDLPDEDTMDGNLKVIMEPEETSPFILLMEEEIDVNLLELTNGITQTMIDIDVPVGSYDLVRVYVKGVNIVMKDGTTYDLKVPSGEQTGIKIFINPEIVVNGGLSSNLLLDFDVSKSFVAKGNRQNITGFNFKPVIKASNLSTAGTMAGFVTEMIEDEPVGVEGVQVEVFTEGILNTTTFTDVDGAYMIMGLEAGSYTVEVAKEGYISQTAEDVQISVANKTVQDFELQLEE